MIFVADEDYNKVIKDDILERVIQGNPAYLWDAERAAKSEIESYLSSRFDTVALFSAVGTNRNAFLVMIFVDVVLYHIHSRINPKQIPELRVDRYERALEWLKMTTKGELTPPDFPILPNENGEQQTSAIGYGSKTKRENDF